MKKTQTTIPAGKFKEKCLQLMDEVGKKRQSIVITKRGKPVAKLVPYDDEQPTLFGCMQGSVKSYGNILDPIDVQWYANA